MGTTTIKVDDEVRERIAEMQNKSKEEVKKVVVRRKKPSPNDVLRKMLGMKKK